VALGENGEVCATVSTDKTLRFWTLRIFAFARSLPGGGALAAVAFSTVGSANVVTATARGKVKRFGIVPKGKERGLFAGQGFG